MQNSQRIVPTVRVKAPTKTGYALINAVDFDHDVHELVDKKDKSLVPPRPTPQNADTDSLRKSLAAALDELAEMQSERDEWKARAEAGEKSKGK